MTDSREPRDASVDTPDETHDDSAEDSPDLTAIEAELDDVQSALDRLAAGTYWTDEVTGDAIPAAVLEADPLERRS